MSEITDICTELAEKIPQVYAAGVEEGKKAGNTAVPSLAQIAKRTEMLYWYQYLAAYFYYDMDWETYEETFVGEPFESLDYPQYTQDITGFNFFTSIYIYNNGMGNMSEIGIPTRKFNGTLDTSSAVNFNSMFSGCRYTEDFGELSDTSKGNNFHNMFGNCQILKNAPTMDLRSATSASYMFSGCIELQTINLKNIKTSIQIGASNWGHLLTVDSLVNTIYQCRDTRSMKTLTMGAPNLTKLSNVYVKLIGITDEMRAEDDLIDEKLPFEVCESTDEGAMLITDYVGLKNWKLA